MKRRSKIIMFSTLAFICSCGLGLGITFLAKEVHFALMLFTTGTALGLIAFILGAIHAAALEDDDDDCDPDDSQSFR